MLSYRQYGQRKMKKRLSYFIPLLSNCGFEADVENRQTHIELSNIKFHSGSFQFDSAEKLRNCIVGKYTAQHTNPDERTKEGRKVIANQLTEKISQLKEKISEYELIIQMCRKNTVKIETL